MQKSKKGYTMQKILLSLTIALFLCSCANAEDKKKMTDEELIAKFMKLDKEVKEVEAKTKALDKLEKKVDELGTILKVDK